MVCKWLVRTVLYIYHIKSYSWKNDRNAMTPYPCASRYRNKPIKKLAYRPIFQSLPIIFRPLGSARIFLSEGRFVREPSKKSKSPTLFWLYLDGCCIPWRESLHTHCIIFTDHMDIYSVSVGSTTEAKRPASPRAKISIKIIVKSQKSAKYPQKKFNIGHPIGQENTPKEKLSHSKSFF